jgi:hypothetical protein
MNWDDDRDTPADPRKCLACGTEKVCPTCSPKPDTRPEVRVIESFRPDGPMYAVITSSTVRQPDTHLALVQAHTPGRGQGWKLAHWRNGTELVTVEGLTKAAARAGLRRAAREHAHALNVKLVLPTREDNPR